MHEPSLQDYLAVLRRRRRIVAIALLAGIGLAVGLSLVQTREYRADALLLLRRTQAEELMVDEVGQVRSTTDATRDLNNEIRLIQSQAVREAAAKAYHGPLDVDQVRASAPQSANNDTIQLSVTSTQPAEAARLVNTYADAYITQRRTSRTDDVLSASDDIQKRLDSVRNQISQVSQPLDDINARIAAAAPDSAHRSSLEDQRNTIELQVLPQLAPLQTREGRLQGQLEQLQLTQDLSQTGGVEIIDPATRPHSPVSPNLPRNLIVGALSGLLVGVALAFLIDRFDDSVRTKEDVERIAALPTIGMIPAADRSTPIDLVSLDNPSSAPAEAFRLVRTSVKFLALGSAQRTLLVTSAAASEGKSVTAANLAIALAQRGDQVLLIGADLRRPRLAEMFGAPAVPGLTTVLLDEAAPESAIYAVAEVPGLHLLPPGPTPPNPAELLDTPRARELFHTLAERYDTVVVDSPPVLPVTDAQVLARLADAVVLVVAYRETSKRGLARAIELLNQVEAKLIGTILNLVPAKEGYGGQLYRYDTYRSRSERRREREATGGKRGGDRAPVRLEPAGPGGPPANGGGNGNGATGRDGGSDEPAHHLRADDPG